MDTLIEDGAHRFEFNREGTGCRAWVSQQLDLLLNEGVVTVKEEVEKVKEALFYEASASSKFNYQTKPEISIFFS